MRIASLNIHSGGGGGFRGGALSAAEKEHSGGNTLGDKADRRNPHALRRKLIGMVVGGGETPPGGLVVLQDEAGWKVKGMDNYGPNVVRFLLNSKAWRWYVVGVYVPTNNVPAVH